MAANLANPRPRFGRGKTMSANCPRPRTIHVRVQSANRQRTRTQTVRSQSAAMNCPRPRTGHRRNLSASMARQRIVRVVASPCSSCRRSFSRFTSASLPPMTSFDPATVRQAVAEFTPLRPQKFHDLLPARDVIAELRQRRASYRAIAELLTQHCLPTSKTAIAAFCHQVLTEIVRPRRRPARRRPPSPAEPNGGMASTAQSEPATDSNGSEATQARSRGPRIAQVRMLKPEST